MKANYILTTAANGMSVRIPVDKYPEWKKAQDRMKESGKMEVDEELQAKLLSALNKQQNH